MASHVDVDPIEWIAPASPLNIINCQGKRGRRLGMLEHRQRDGLCVTIGYGGESSDVRAGSCSGKGHCGVKEGNTTIVEDNRKSGYIDMVDRVKQQVPVIHRKGKAVRYAIHRLAVNRLPVVVLVFQNVVPRVLSELRCD